MQRNENGGSTGWNRGSSITCIHQFEIFCEVMSLRFNKRCKKYSVSSRQKQ